MPPTPPAIVQTVTTTQDMFTAVSPIQQGVESYLSRGGSSSSMHVALVERKIPTKEEIEAKKRNFNVIFWGRLNDEDNDANVQLSRIELDTLSLTETFVLFFLS